MNKMFASIKSMFENNNGTRAKLRLLLVDTAIIFFMPILALFVRMEGDMARFNTYLVILLNFLPLAIPLSLFIFYIFGLYSRLWRYATAQDMLAVVGAGVASAAVTGAIGLHWQIPIPHSFYIISVIFKIAAMLAARLIIKLIHRQNPQHTTVGNNRFLIVGAGDAGAMIAREIKQRNTCGVIVGFVDDDQAKVGNRILGIPILGRTTDMELLVSRHRITEIIIAIPSASGTNIRRISNLCKNSGCKVRILPGIYELIEGKETVSQLRDIDINDLLRRESAEFSASDTKDYIRDKTVLITGAGGSIGSELARQIARLQPRRLFLLGRGENSIYEIHNEISSSNPELECIPVIADVADYEGVKEAFTSCQPQIVFHAAAHKHVPLMEAQPYEAVRVNVLGTKNLVELAQANQTEIFVMISTDKAVNPTNVMGASKRTAELIVQSANKYEHTKFLVVRFGNVLGSRGSVIPLFRKQIANGGPITITHPDVTRYFMTIPEAAQLVLQAGAMATGGEVFLLDMGKPVRILDMARDLVALHGLLPDEDIQFVFTGLRPGEKLYEELLTSEEGAVRTTNKAIYKAQLTEVNTVNLELYLQDLKQAGHNSTAIIKAMSKWLVSYKSAALKTHD